MMLLQDTNMVQLSRHYLDAGAASSCAHLLDAKAVARARKMAKKQGLWDALPKLCQPDAPLYVIKRSDYRSFRREGTRGPYELQDRPRQKRVQDLALAVWLGHPAVPVDALQDQIWALCDDHNWVMPAHEPRAIDLRAASVAAVLATTVCVLADKLEAEVVQRVEREIERRIFDVYFDHRVELSWKTCPMNWNHVCNGDILRAALCLIKDPERLARMTHPMIQNMSYAVEGFAKDGGCLEGPGYWNYGFGHYAQAAFALWQRTGGAVNIMAGNRIEAICRYPLAAYIDPPMSATFADASHGFISPVLALQINRFHAVPRLYSLCKSNKDGTIRVGDMHGLALASGEKIGDFVSEDQDALLPDTGLVKLRGGAEKRAATLMALAGRNDVPHNHNDVGSFIFHRDGRLLLDDPGAPKYSAKTFSARRYEIAHCNSFGHSLPVINGQLQRFGGDYFGTLSVENLNGQGAKTAGIDMTRAYAAGVARSLVRTLTLDGNGRSLMIEDHFVFDRKPKSLEEAFVTYEAVKISRDGRSVQIGPKRGGAVLRASDNTPGFPGFPGKFAVVEVPGSLEEGRTDKAIQRISFTPDTLAKNMTLRFTLE